MLSATTPDRGREITVPKYEPVKQNEHDYRQRFFMYVNFRLTISTVFGYRVMHSYYPVISYQH